MSTSNNSKTAAEATKIMITRSNGVGVLTKAQDGRWDITLNGTKAHGNNYYDNTQVDRIVSKAIADGAKVEVL